MRNKTFSLGLAFCVAMILMALTLIPLTMLEPAHAAPLGVGGTRATLTVTEILATGVAESLATSDGDGHKFLNTGKEFLIITNDYTDTVTATIVTAYTFAGYDIADVDVGVAAGATQLVGPFNTSVFNYRTGSDKGYVYINWDAAVTGTVASSVTLLAYQLDDGS